MTIITLLLAALFGASDQYIGSFSAHPWTADVSGLSAPWLALPFIVGAVQHNPLRAAVMGIACTFTALLGYTLMTFSPLEQAHLTLRGLAGFLHGGNLRWFVSGAATGPLFGWLGYRWRAEHLWPAGVATAALISLEPLARAQYGNTTRSATVRTAELLIGALLAVGAIVLGWFQRRRASTLA